ncbi:uncharacterized protein LOC107013504 [Solanum pennellii]|uniref:Uncharacterized protein LOC107013504 n=1 Tax=Solanum pennellii TaxID=28526 RepID=A0ABM1GBV7_SOLPN|nr:uncharacterized protein LOC107013504 [Solanum pennellii]
MGDIIRVVYTDYNIDTMIIQFITASQLPKKIHGSHDFAMWKAQLSMLMHIHDLYGHLDGSTPSHLTLSQLEQPLVPIMRNSLWFRQDQLIQNALMASVDPTIAAKVATTNSAKTTCDALHTAYENKS